MFTDNSDKHRCRGAKSWLGGLIESTWPVQTCGDYEMRVLICQLSSYMDH